MTGKKSARRKSKRPNGIAKLRGETHADATESRTADAATVAWMLCLMATALAELSGVGVRVAMLAGNSSDFLPVMSSVMLFTALVSGVLTLALTATVARVRRHPAPPSIVAVAIAIGIVPILTFVALFIQAPH